MFATKLEFLVRYVGEREQLREIEIKNWTEIAKTENKIKNQSEVIRES